MTLLLVNCTSIYHFPAQIFKRVGPVAVRLLLIPGIVEALVSGGVGIPVFGLPVMLSFAMGFILKPVDPAIAMTMMFKIQEENKGIQKGAALWLFGCLLTNLPPWSALGPLLSTSC